MKKCLLHCAVDIGISLSFRIQLNCVASNCKVVATCCQVVKASTEVDVPTTVDAELPSVGCHANIGCLEAILFSVPCHDSVAGPIIETTDDAHFLHLNGIDGAF